MDKDFTTDETTKSAEASGRKPPTPQPPVYFQDTDMPTVTFKRLGKYDRSDDKSVTSARSKASSRSTRSAKREVAARMAELEIRRRSMQISNELRQAELDLERQREEECRRIEIDREEARVRLERERDDERRRIEIEREQAAREMQAMWKRAELELAMKREQFEIETEINATKARLEALSDDGDDLEARSLDDSLSRIPQAENRTEDYVRQLAHATPNITSTPGRDVRQSPLTIKTRI